MRLLVPTLSISAGLLGAPALAAPSPSLAPDLLLDTARVQALQARWDDAERLLERAAGLAAPDDGRRQTAIASERARVLSSRASFQDLPFGPALAAAQDALDRARSLADPELLGEALLAWASTHYTHQFRVAVPDYAPVRRALGEAQALFEPGGDPRRRAETLFYLGLVHERLEEAAQARVVYERALAIAEPAGDGLMQAYLYRHLAGFQGERLGLPGVLDYHQRSLRLRERVGSATGSLSARLAVAETLLEMKQPEQARAHYQEALDLARSIGVARGEASAQAGLAATHQAAGRAEQAREHAREALVAAARSPDPGLLNQIVERVTAVLAPPAR